MSAGRDYAGVAVAAPVTVPYAKLTPHGAAWFLGRALAATLETAGLAKDAVDGLIAASFTLAPDTVVALTEHFGIEARHIDWLPTGGASGVMALRRAARAVQCRDAEVVACIAGDTTDRNRFADLVANFSTFSSSAVYPYGAAGPNGVFALITRQYMERHGAAREDFGRLCVTQRYNANRYEHALLRDRPLDLAAYLAARPVAEPLHLYDCVMPCAGAEGFLVLSEARAAELGLPYARLLAAVERHNAYRDDTLFHRGGWRVDRDLLYDSAGVGPDELDCVQLYDDYPVIVFQQLEDLGLCDPGEAARFVTDRDLRVGLPGLALNTSGGQLSGGQAGAAGGFMGVVEALRQVTGQALGNPHPGARRALASGFGMVNFDHCLCSAAAILEGARP